MAPGREYIRKARLSAPGVARSEMELLGKGSGDLSGDDSGRDGRGGMGPRDTWEAAGLRE